MAKEIDEMINQACKPIEHEQALYRILMQTDKTGGVYIPLTTLENYCHGFFIMHKTYNSRTFYEISHIWVHIHGLMQNSGATVLYLTIHFLILIPHISALLSIDTYCACNRNGFSS